MLVNRNEPLMDRGRFVTRLARHTVLPVAVIAASLALGTLGYRFIAGLPWLDAFLNASMILAGMGPVDPMSTAAAKLFAGIYAIFSGVVFLSVVGVLMAPLVHRFLHRFHLEAAEDGKPRPRS